MLGFLLLLFVATLLILLASVVPVPSSLSSFERKRRSDAGDKMAALETQRTDLAVDIISLQRVVTAILLVIFVIQAIAVFGWIIGGLIAIAVALEYSALARLPLIHHFSQKQYEKYELHILEFAQKYRKVFWWFRTVLPHESDASIHSKAELSHMVMQSVGVLSADEKQLISNSLKFDERLVKDIMTPRSMIDSVKKSEILGPLVLDVLHKTGHSRFPVIDGDLDHVVGTLYLRDVLTLDTSRKHTSMVETAMEKRVYYVHEDQSLTHALTAFLKTHHHLFVVVNEFRETVGLLSLEDTVEALIGRPIVDEFDAHDDLRSVATRHPKSNPRSGTTTDV